jgi:short-subunit dehydrogenase
MQAAVATTIVVTGASSGIGRELAIQLAAPGREIWLVGRDGGRLDEVADQVHAKGAVPQIVQLDLSDLDAAARFLHATFAADKRVDVVYLAAAITQFGEFKDTWPGDWKQIYHVNLLSPVQWALHFYQNMVIEGSGRIVLISSLCAYAGYPTATAYATMKAGLLGLFRSLWHEGKAYGVTMHLASPGYVNTSIYRSALYRETTYAKTMGEIKSLGFRIISAEKTARIILRSIHRGEREFALPAYASLMKWAAPRLPMLIDLVHARIVKCFRQAS